MPVRFQDKRGTATQWRLANPVLADGEFGIESDTGVVKVGNGLDGWNSRPPILGSTYLPILGKAADADKLDGLDSTAFLKVSDATATYLPSATAASTYVPLANTSYNNDINTVVKRDASGNTTLNQLTISQSTPQSASQATRKDYVDAVSTALTNATGSTSATRKLGYYWGSFTAFPTIGVLPGDTCLRTNIGTNGSWWSYTGVSALGSNGWLPEGNITCLSTARPTTALYTGLTIVESDTRRAFTYDSAVSRWLFSGGPTPSVMVRRSTNYNMVINAWTSYPWESIVTGDTDDTSMWAIGTPTRLIAPIDGFYMLTGSIGFTAASTAPRYVAVNINGAAVSNMRRVTSMAQYGTELPFVARVKLSAGQYAEVFYNTAVASDYTGVFGETQPRAELTWAGNY